SLTTVKKIALPVVTTEQKVRFAILCALEVYKEPSFVAWAADWMSGKDRIQRAAEAAAEAAEAEAAEAAEAEAAEAAAEAAEAAYAARSAVRAAVRATSKQIDLTKIAEEACK